MTGPRWFSQFGEDEILDRLFEHRTKGTCVEVGAHDGVHGSNTYHFERLGWTCVLVEPIPSLAREIRLHRSCPVFECAASSEEGAAEFFVVPGLEVMSGLRLSVAASDEAARLKRGIQVLRVRTRRLDDILSESRVSDIDFLSIDVEGHELEVLRGLDLEKTRPGILIVEDNSAGADLSVRDHLERFGYRPFLRTGVNDWYSTDEFLRSLDLGAADHLAAWKRREAVLAHRVRWLAPLVPASLRARVLRLLRTSFLKKPRS